MCEWDCSILKIESLHSVMIFSLNQHCGIIKALRKMCLLNEIVSRVSDVARRATALPGAYVLWAGRDLIVSHLFNSPCSTSNGYIDPFRIIVKKLMCRMYTAIWCNDSLTITILRGLRWSKVITCILTENDIGLVCLLNVIKRNSKKGGQISNFSDKQNRN